MGRKSHNHAPALARRVPLLVFVCRSLLSPVQSPDACAVNRKVMIGTGVIGINLIMHVSSA